MCKCPGYERKAYILRCWYDRPCHTWHCFVTGGLFCCIPHTEVDSKVCLAIWWFLFVVTFPMAIIFSLIFGIMGCVTDIGTVIYWVCTFGFCGNKCCSGDNCRDDCRCVLEDDGALFKPREYCCCQFAEE